MEVYLKDNESYTTRAVRSLEYISIPTLSHLLVSKVAEQYLELAFEEWMTTEIEKIDDVSIEKYTPTRPPRRGLDLALLGATRQSAN
jgi:hypothetical protein